MKKILLLFFGVLTITFMSGCSNDEDRIVIYTSMEEERNAALREQIKEEFPDLDIVVQHMATGNSAAKIKNEKTNVEADIVLDLETAHMVSIQDNFADLSDFDDSIYLDGVNTSTNYYTWVKNTMSLIIDNKYFKNHNLEIPKTYEDLLKPEYKNLIAMPDPKTSGTGYAFYLNAVNVMGENEAIEYFKDLKENLREFTTSGSGPTNLLKQGEIAIAMGMTYQGVEEINNGANFKVIEFDTGLLYNTTSIGIIDGKEENENVRKVFQWINTEFSLYDKEHFIPGKIFKEQTTKIENYPETVKLADMTGITDNSVKENLLKKWKY